MASPGSPEATVEWVDTKRYLWLLGVIIPLLPLAAMGLYAMSDLTVFLWIGPIVVYGVIPVVDLAIGRDAENPPDELLRSLEEDRYYRWCVYAYLPVQFVSLVAACWLAGSGTLTPLGYLGLALTTGVMAGIAINTAHELGHKKESVERRLSKIALAQSFYGHFYIEHNRGHHVRVATPEDPASSRLGESFWRFLPRSVWGSLTSAWRLERTRLARGGSSPWTIRNDVLNAWLMSVVLWGVLIAAFGPRIIPFLLIQAVFGFSLLEVVNYIEHYGLARRREPGGRYERCAPRHSWNSNNVATNLLLFHLQRHSDHHANPTRRYQALRHVDEAPQMPSGYAAMITVAYVPPLWRWLMDRRVLAHYGGDASLANVRPGREARYGVAAG
ncbi:MAG TPA: alkane 1-monooxygenase [Pseudonocardiaceae bacterium]